MYSVTPVTTPISAPPALVATPLPDTAGTLRVPPTDVAPSFSNEQVRSESHGSNNPSGRIVSSQQQTAASPPATFVQSPNPAPQLAGNVQTNFLAQLISQDISPQATIYLAEYQKLVYFSNVKYKPSNAGKPAPAGLFEKLLKSDAPSASAPIVLPTIPAPVARIRSADIEQDVTEDEGYDEPPVFSQPAIYVPDAAQLSARASKAYVSTSSRNDEFLAPPKAETTEEPA